MPLAQAAENLLQGPCGSAADRGRAACSLAPSSRMTAFVPSGTDQSRRGEGRPTWCPPETPALLICTARPRPVSARSSRTGNAAAPRQAEAGGQGIAERHDPQPGPRRLRAGESTPDKNAAETGPPASANVRAPHLDPPRPRLPYERGTAGPSLAPASPTLPNRSDPRKLRDSATSIQDTSMHDASALRDPARACEPTPRSRSPASTCRSGGGASRVHILKDVDLHIGSGRGDRPGRSLRFRQVDPADDHGRAGAARLPARSRVAGEDLRALGEDALGALFAAAMWASCSSRST